MNFYYCWLSRVDLIFINQKTEVMKKFKGVVILIILFLCCLKVDAQDQPPNIVLIVADDLGYGDLQCYGADNIKTPNIDQLAKEGVRFTHFYSNGAECTPTRAALLSGRYQQRVGGLECAIGLGNHGRYPDAVRLAKAGNLGLPISYGAIPSILKKAGYNTALIGKWHLGYAPKFSPHAHGFDFSLGPLGGGVDYFMHSTPVGMFLGKMSYGEHDFFRNGHEQHREGYYITDLITDESVNWINIQKRDRPFFLYIPYTAPHKPYQGPDDYTGKKLTVEQENAPSKENYIEMVEELDKGVGKILAKLKAEGLEKNTLVIFVSDNGPAGPGSAGPFRDNKGTLFEGGIRVPCIIKWPGHITPGLTSRQVAITMDLTASIARIAHASAPPNRPFDGTDIIKDVEKDRPVYARTLFWRKQRTPRIVKAVHEGHMKYIYVKNRGDVSEYLFDLSKDPREKNNLKEKYPDKLLKLKKLLKNWEAEVRPER